MDDVRVHPHDLKGDDTVEARRRSLARLYPCSGCRGRLPRRELTKLTEDNHDNLTYFHGDRLCRECADIAHDYRARATSRALNPRTTLCVDAKGELLFQGGEE